MIVEWRLNSIKNLSFLKIFYFFYSVGAINTVFFSGKMISKFFPSSEFIAKMSAIKRSGFLVPVLALLPIKILKKLAYLVFLRTIGS